MATSTHGEPIYVFRLTPDIGLRWIGLGIVLSILLIN